VSLLVDERIGSGEFAKLLAQLHLPVDVTHLEYGDFAFLGRGEDDLPVPVGVERKALSDFVSSVRTGRMTEQVRGMHQCYQAIWIVIEGVWRADPQGANVLVPQGTHWVPFVIGSQVVTYRELEGMMLTQEIRAGVNIRRVHSKPDFGKFLGALYHYWVDKAYEQHRSHLSFKTGVTDKALLVQPSLTRQVAACLPGVGWIRSGAVSEHFPSVEAMCHASLKEWTSIDGIGKTIATKIIAALKGE
jgi:ERCC4-type nuclease